MSRWWTTAVVCALVWSGSPAPVAVAQDCAPGSDQVIPDVPWPQRYLAPDRVWPLTRGGSVLVAVVDTGVSTSPPSLQGVVAGGGFSAAGQGGPTTDCAGRGTFMAGLIASQPTKGVGLVGVAPAARVLPVRVTDRAEEVDPGKLAAGIRHAADAGAQVIAVSVGTPAGTPDLQAAVKYAIGRNAVVIANADAANREEITYPAAFEDTVAVGGLAENGSPTSTSRRTRVTLMAPGAGVVSLPPSGKGHINASGVGIGVAFVAAIAALVRSYLPELTAAQVRARLELTADHLPGDVPNALAGFGVVNLHAAVTWVLPQETGEKSAAMPVPVPNLPPVVVADRAPARTAMLVAGLVVAVLVLGGIGLALGRRGKARGWRPVTGEN